MPPTATPPASRPASSWLARIRLLLPLFVLLVQLAHRASAAQLPLSLKQAHPQSQPGLAHRIHANDVQDDDPALVPAIRLSHHGLYINRPHTAAGHPAPSFAAPPRLPLTIHFDTAVYRPETAVVHFGPLRRRSRDQVMLECGKQSGGIESCQDDDLGEAKANRSHADSLECRFDRPGAVKSGGRIVLDSRACTGWDDYWAGPHIYHHRRSDDDDRGSEALTSFVVSLSVDAREAGKGSQNTHQRWWVGQLELDHSRASWPLAGNARSRRPGTDDRVWHQDNANRISGSMENPIIPKASKDEPADPQQNVYVEQSSWNLGVQIRIPLAITTPPPSAQNRTASALTAIDDSAPSTEMPLLLPPEEVFAPVAGQVVWSRPYLRHKPPLVGDGAGWNDEADHCLMIRDEWSVVYQIFGLDPATLSFREGDEVARGDVLGHALREGLSSIPPCTDPPADHSETKDDRSVRFYPHRYRKLEIRVARPHRDWTEWKDPDELGWQYFQPLQVFREGRTREGKRYQSTVPPYGSPTTLYFGRPSTDPLNVPPVAFASSDDFFVPTLSGQVEMYAGFEAFQSTPGDPADGMEPLALFAMDLGIRKRKDGERPPNREDPCDLGGGGGDGGDDTSDKWRNLWEHAKLPNVWTGAFIPTSTSTPASVRWHSKLFSHYQPSFSYGTWFPAKMSSQFDEKSRHLYYVVGRQVRGEPKIKGSFDVQRDLMDEGPGRYRIVVRGRDYWGNAGCVASDVNLA
ncbi:uncharacterized protein PFL1_04847 [Pseudozyma flocculosa PF-1]|uniref:Peptidase M23 domain-containing protein n=1 Tax=Pseudozyma flocculosa PF-1 TaxID=1277687 RepID=A0A061H5I3_9BASI|nr:uncharacterized protein PFL1_04847 [Pseudozyma flocculosa PF-1]EPQ27709.1 hypothetical protein PFL1_04847 [Pseudozyma flocculosa PF-1]